VRQACPASFVEGQAVAGQAGSDDHSIGSYSDRHHARPCPEHAPEAAVDWDAHRKWRSLVAAVDAAGNEVARPHHTRRERVRLVHPNRAVSARFEA
jgi:hypothetical protein